MFLSDAAFCMISRPKHTHTPSLPPSLPRSLPPSLSVGSRRERANGEIHHSHRSVLWTPHLNCKSHLRQGVRGEPRRTGEGGAGVKERLRELQGYLTGCRLHHASSSCRVINNETPCEDAVSDRGRSRCIPWQGCHRTTFVLYFPLLYIQYS